MPHAHPRLVPATGEKLDAVVGLIRRGVDVLNARLIRCRRRLILLIYALPEDGGTRSYVRDGQGWRPGPMA